MKRLFISAFAIGMACLTASPCTNIIVGKKASTDGSVICTYSCDGYGGYSGLSIRPAADYKPGTMMALRMWGRTDAVPDSIPQAAHTFNVVNNMNEFQLTITETTFDGRTELRNPDGLINYPQLMQLGLQRAKTAREAITVMADLMDRYGYSSEGETFSVCDPNEAWIMEIIGKGKGGKGAIWVAIRIPDDCVSAHANQSRIDKIPFDDKENCMYAKDVVSFAREKGYYKGSDKDFSFCDAYCPLDFSGRRFCEARVWSFFTKWCDPAMNEYLPFILGTSDRKMPLYIKPTKKLSVQDIQNAMRDHYEGTPLDETNDYSWGPYASPNRPSPLTYEVNGKKYFQERPIGTVQSMFTLVAQMRNYLPNEIGGVLWFGNDDSNMVAYVPIYCGSTQTPECFDASVANGQTFSFKSAFWMQNWVANMVYPRYNLMIGDLREAQSELENRFHGDQSVVEALAKAQYDGGDKDGAVKMLNDYSIRASQQMMDRWMQLAQLLIVKYNDFKVRPSENGKVVRGRATDYPIPQGFLEQMAKVSGDRYLVPDEKHDKDASLHNDVLR